MAFTDVPLVADPTALAWRCEQRLHCCRRWEVAVTSLELDRMRRNLEAAWPVASVLAEDGPERASDAPPRWFLPKEGEDCALLEDGLCGYRVRFGTQTQPRVCRTFPYLSVLTPTRHLLGLDFTCPTALRLLAEADSVEAITHTDDEAPLPFVRNLCDPEGADDDGWRAQKKAFEAFQAAEGPPFVRLHEALSAIVELAPLTPVDGVDWASDSLPGELFGPLLVRGIDPLGAAALFGPSEEDVDLDDLPRVADEGALVARYFAHRLLVPGFLQRPPSAARLAEALAAAAVRWFVEHTRGAPPLAAVRRTDLWLLHRPHMASDEGMGALALFGLLPRPVNGFAIATEA